MNEKKILVITPISHLDNVEEILKSIKGTKLFLIPECDKNELKNHADSYAIFTNPNKSKVFLGKENLSFFKKLKYICTASTGTNHIDKNFCHENNISIISLKEERSVINQIPSTAEHAFALMMTSLRNVNEANRSVNKGLWNYEPFIGRQLKSLIVGVVGYGRLGTFFSNYCDAFGSQVVVFDPYKTVNHPRISQVGNLKDLSTISDIISLHVHVTSETLKFINFDFLNNCKKTVLIVNTSRGEIIDELALLKFLKKNKNSKYATDVLSSEIKGINDNILKKYADDNRSQITITPHIGGMTKEAQNMAFSHAANLLKKVIN